ncbi:MAG: TIGR02996 domain-containing protein [Fimbriiglobus sp.]|jgi:uncharacterized protein (TIGR02996 family)|nr:TIGR02996 domain-containing protein [Fimbriiglobus sp.]
MSNAYHLPNWELLLKAVTASPDDDLPRLVAADWLDESGDPDRAEFIRLQIERARADRPELEYREKQLLNNPLFGPLWAVEACPRIATLDFGSSVRAVGVSGSERVTFRRGFPFRVICTAAEWLRHGSGVVPRQPVRELTLTRCNDLEPPRWWEMIDTLRQLDVLAVDTSSIITAAFIRNHICPGVQVFTPEGPVEDEVIVGRFSPPPRRVPASNPPFAGPEDLPDRHDVPF